MAEEKEVINTPNYERHQKRELNSAPAVVSVDRGLIPGLKSGESFSMTVAQFPDHGRPCFVGSAIKSNRVLLEVARSLTSEESKKINDAFGIEVERILDGNEKQTTAWSARGKPDISMLLVGRPFDPKSLRLYYTRAEYNGVPAVYLLAVSKLKDASRVEHIFEEAGYQGTKTWETRRVH